jgi:hypothetical protein
MGHHLSPNDARHRTGRAHHGRIGDTRLIMPAHWRAAVEPNRRRRFCKGARLKRRDEFVANQVSHD